MTHLQSRYDAAVKILRLPKVKPPVEQRQVAQIAPALAPVPRYVPALSSRVLAVILILGLAWIVGWVVISVMARA